MTERTPQATPTGNARRRLVRGVFSVPAVLTLHSGRAMAAASSMRCIANQAASPVNPTPSMVGVDDKYLRYELYALKNPLNASVDSYWIYSSDLQIYVRKGQPTSIPAGYWVKFNDGNNSVDMATATTTKPTKVNYSMGKASKFAVIRIDANGAVVGVGNGSSGSAVSDSCWNSFAAGTS